MIARSPSPWTFRVLAGHRRHHAELLHEGVVIRRAITGTWGAAATQGRRWLDDALAGFILPLPLDQMQHRLAALPLRAPAPQDHDTSPLPLFGDHRNQLDLLGGGHG
jgi:hypothetical protein